ncbi:MULTISPECIES: ArsC family reductase [unclassified Sphingopyxis]|uniref:ArsC family reductase n=1 Tax=unclassified Sphingopyxis TaxID=2614943 RepID=UPI00285F330D|nr:MULTISPECIES: ArsC family reductase [unclassified Sphingopyxis]MDR7058698.1 arsenate reductase [Sphingopyxis sp. BE235]MDR7179116.1 arsenate reductase [Sphingopyxis sp. BE249]
MTMILYGISNCDTVKKARRWLDEQGVAYRFHDVRKDGLDAARLQDWIDALGWEKLLNKAGTTFRKLPDAEKEGLDAAAAKALMLDQPAMIRRPVVEAAGNISVGFSADDWQARFAA